MSDPDTRHLAVLRSACRAYLSQAGLSYLQDEQGNPVLLFENGVQVFVTPLGVPDGPTVVRVDSLCVKDMRIDGDLGIFLAEESGKIAFGKLVLHPELQEVRVEHVLLGDYLNRDELEYAVRIVAAATDQYDDRLKERWGGKTRRDL